MHQIVTDLSTWRRFIDDVAFPRELLPANHLLRCEGMIVRNNGENPLGPQRRRCNTWPRPFARHKGDVDTVLADGAEVHRRFAIDQVDANIRILMGVATKQFCEKTTRNGGVDSNLQTAVFGASDGRYVVHAVTDGPQDRSRSLKEVLSPHGEPNTAAVSMEQGCSDMMFQITNATAQCRLLNADGGSSLAKTSVFGRGHEVVQMTKLKSPASGGDGSIGHASVISANVISL